MGSLSPQSRECARLRVQDFGRFDEPVVLFGGPYSNLQALEALSTIIGERPAICTGDVVAYGANPVQTVNLTKAMAVDHAPEGIRVNCVAPGPIYTPMVYARGMSDELRAHRAKNNLLQQEGTGWDVGNGVVYLASDMAKWITGTVLSIDGGVTAGAVSTVTPSGLFEDDC